MKEKTLNKKSTKKTDSQYKLFRNKVCIILGAVLLVVGLVGLAIFETYNSHYLSMVEAGNSVEYNQIVGMLNYIGTFALVLSGFFIFKRLSLGLMVLGIFQTDLYLILGNADNAVIGVAFTIIALICFMISEKARDTKRGNKKLKLDQDIVEGLIFDEDGSGIEVLAQASYDNTKYKADLYLVLSILWLCLCGVGLLMPFGAKALVYNKACGSMFGKETIHMGKKNHNPNKPFKDLIPNGDYYIKGEHFQIKSKYFSKALGGWICGIGYIVVSSILSAIIKKPTIADELDTTAGTLIFSNKLMQEVDIDIAQTFEVYSKQQSQENKQYLIDALVEWSENYDKASQAEGERLERYEQEKIRSAQQYAKKADVYYDGKNYYYSDKIGNSDTSAMQKLEHYDEQTHTGYYIDETGKKVEIKNVK